MKASELRIGNWVYSNSDYPRKAIQIKASDFPFVGAQHMTNPPRPVAEPIPLDEEWLIKFGCKKLGPSWWETPNGVQFNFSDGNKCGLITFGSRHVNFWHVHTLQNIISLTGEELELKPSSPTS